MIILREIICIFVSFNYYYQKNSGIYHLKHNKFNLFISYILGFEFSLINAITQMNIIHLITF